jgi:hypothetical protein
MRFCHPFPLTANAHDGEHALFQHKQVTAKSRAERDQRRFIVFSPRTIFPGPIARPTPFRKNLTEIPFAPNFSNTNLEVL